jgi:hypothetical protein
MFCFLEIALQVSVTVRQGCDAVATICIWEKCTVRCNEVKHTSKLAPIHPFVILDSPGVSEYFRTESITNYTLTTINTRWEATQRVMAAKLTTLTHKIVIQLHLVAESSTICSFRSRRPVRKLLVTTSYGVAMGRRLIHGNTSQQMCERDSVSWPYEMNCYVLLD